ncbi:hypothetical protein MTO96_001080 [Rhipicephalus appendiculatus]
MGALISCFWPQCVDGVVESPRLPISDYVPPYYSVACNIREFNMAPPGEEAVPSPVEPPMPPPPISAAPERNQDEEGNVQASISD